MLTILRNVLLILAVLIGVVFAYFNTSSVQIDYLFGQLDMPLVLALALVLFVGLALGVLVGLPYTMRTRSRLASTRRRLQQAEVEVKNLRNQPLHDA
ncbi:MAG: LapA family protein [Nevskiales bacterium]